MAFEFEAVDIDDVKATLSTRTRTSKWRENIEEFMQADVAAARIKTDEGDNKPGSVASGLNNAIRTAAKAGKEYPLAVKQSTSVDGNKSVYLVRTDLVDITPAKQADETEAEAELEPVA